LKKEVSHTQSITIRTIFRRTE